MNTSLLRLEDPLRRAAGLSARSGRIRSRRDSIRQLENRLGILLSEEGPRTPPAPATREVRTQNLNVTIDNDGTPKPCAVGVWVVVQNVYKPAILTATDPAPKGAVYIGSTKRYQHP